MSAKGAQRPNRGPKKIAARRNKKGRSGSSASTGRSAPSGRFASIGRSASTGRATTSARLGALANAGGMKFGLRIPSFALGPRTASLAEMGAYLRRAEDLGFDCAVSIDHLLLTPPAYACTWLEPMALLSALAGVTRTIKLGTMVLVLPLRNPAYFAKEWATLDLLSGGRSILGVGVGWHEEEFALMGVPHEERGRRMDEMLEAVTALWAGDRVTYAGKYYKFRDLTIDPKPAQKPHPPIWIGGGSQPFEKVYGQTVTNIDPVLRRIAKYAKTWVPHSSATADMVKGDWEKIQRFMGEVGRPPGDMSKVYSNFVWVLKKGEKPETAIPHFKTYSGMDLPYWKEFYLLGEAEELAEKIRAKVANLGGCEYIVLNPLDWGIEQLELLANEVLPRVARP
jgi:probable F420-dependent oxidoreductase